MRKDEGVRDWVYRNRLFRRLEARRHPPDAYVRIVVLSLVVRITE
jgi:hypothetical protein